MYLYLGCDRIVFLPAVAFSLAYTELFSSKYVLQEATTMFSNKAYVLIRTVPERTKEAFHNLQKHPDVKAIDIITGPYDIVAVVEAKTSDEVLDFVMDQIRYTDGIADTLTCFAVQISD
jgi:DNA-binding Lrp family transcriptional regulator